MSDSKTDEEEASAWEKGEARFTRFANPGNAHLKT